MAFQINGPWGNTEIFYILNQEINLIKKIDLYPIYFFNDQIKTSQLLIKLTKQKVKD
ncbi:hypothetical protein FC19_GL000562 [Liquorilactobacillus aquaticus DSM 21051]|uniref:Uncharacterized protein n=1 Tax=Liquorilactobacillus aquaticus DSM 21051 TaxID=1423725 RepID=A0A0R2D6P2_9LACO|nr:hypothetical protein FC19_GL000562 [Liquorilactobacillus aquaticus DSM 21051]